MDQNGDTSFQQEESDRLIEEELNDLDQDFIDAESSDLPSEKRKPKERPPGARASSRC